MPGDNDTKITLSFDAFKKLLEDPEIFTLTGVWIAGIEVTQGIQWYDASAHLTDPADRGPDNGVTLVAYKPAWVRVYIGGLFPHAGVQGVVKLQRHGILGEYEDSYTPVQQWPVSTNYDPSVTYATTRGSLYYSLNFVIPAAEMHGRFRLAVSIKTAAGKTADGTADVDATLLQTLRVRGIPIRYWGPDKAGNQVQLGPTTAADFANTATWSMLTYPVQSTPDISLAGIFTWSETLAGPADVPGGCSTGWYDLLFWLHVAKVIDGDKTDVIYYGLLPSATPDGPVIGCDSSGASAGKQGDGITMAHEMGHYQGFPHAPCGSVGTPDAGYPAYEPYDTTAARTASIGEFGLDVSTGTIYDPATAKDYMSYCGPQWTSLYHYRIQLLSSFFDPRYIDSGDRPWWWDHYKLYRPYDVARDLPRPPEPVEVFRVHEQVERQLEPSVVLSGIIVGGNLEVRSILRIDAARQAGNARSERVELLDANDKVLAQAPLQQSSLMGCSKGCGCSGCSGRGAPEGCASVVQAVLPYSDHCASIRILRDGEAIWRRDRPSQSPTIKRVTAKYEEGHLSVEWSHSGDVTETHLRMSRDNGKTWELLELRAERNKTTIPAAVLPPGEHLLQVIASDGFHTVTSDAVRFEIPNRPPGATIHWPLDGAAVPLRAKMRLWGTGFGARGEVLADETHRWAIDGRPVGVGRDIWVDPPVAEGEHRATLTVRDDHGEHSVSNRFWVTCSGRAPYRTTQ